MLSNPGCKRSNLHAALSQPDLKIFIKDVRDKHGRKRPINVRSWSTVKDVKDRLSQLLHVPPCNQRLFFGPGNDLPNHRTLNDAGIYRSGETLWFDIHSSAGCLSSTDKTSLLSSGSASKVCVSSVLYDLTPKRMRRIVQQIRRGIDLGLKPEIALDGSGGTYFMKDARKVKVAAFKPSDEEPYAPNNPRGYLKGLGFNSVEAMRGGILPGEACVREVAAFLIDHGGFSGVPITTLIEARHSAFHNNSSQPKEHRSSIGLHSLSEIVSTPSSENLVSKVGSCQEFIAAECTMDDLSPSMISVDEVHKIAILDIRVMNADRNSANLLCKRLENANGKSRKYSLTPIDHGYCLRSECDVCWFDWCWLDWPQLKEPLSKKSRSYIMNLKVERDAQLLQERLRIPSEALDIFRASTKLLQAGVRAGLTLYEIALMCCRHDDAGDIPSKLEVMVKTARDLSNSSVLNGKFHHSDASSALVDQLHSNLKLSTHMSAVSLLSLERSSDFPSYGTSSKVATQPVLEQSSCSDFSYSVGEDVVDEEECEEWAKLILADVSIEEKTHVPPEKTRLSLPVQSGNGSESLGSSPAGFWHHHPVDSSVPKSNVHWDTPPSSPSKFFSASQATTKFDNRVTTGGTDFSRSGWKTDGITIPSKPKGITRSQSYSAFSLHTVRQNHLKSDKLSMSRTAENDQFRVYFSKFVDLLIVRETSRQSHNDSQ